MEDAKVYALVDTTHGEQLLAIFVNPEDAALVQIYLKTTMPKGPGGDRDIHVWAGPLIKSSK